VCVSSNCPLLVDSINTTKNPPAISKLQPTNNTITLMYTYFEAQSYFRGIKYTMMHINRKHDLNHTCKPCRIAKYLDRKKLHPIILKVLHGINIAAITGESKP
jgi:hypothetical protein